MKLLSSDLAKKLNIPRDTLDRWIRQGRIPVLRKGDACEFSRGVLIRWAKEHNIDFSETPSVEGSMTVDHPDSLASAMIQGGVFYKAPGDGIDEVLQNAVSVIPGLSEKMKQRLLSMLIERERMTSTGIGGGVAIPHPRTPISDICETSFITTCFLESPIDFKAVDDRPVFVLFILSSPDIKKHLHLLSRLAFCVRDGDFISFLKKEPEPDALYSMVAEFEKRLEVSR